MLWVLIRIASLICFSGELTKIILQLLSDTLFICSIVTVCVNLVFFLSFLSELTRWVGRFNRAVQWDPGNNGAELWMPGNWWRWSRGGAWCPWWRDWARRRRFILRWCCVNTFSTHQWTWRRKCTGRWPVFIGIKAYDDCMFPCVFSSPEPKAHKVSL